MTEGASAPGPGDPPASGDSPAHAQAPESGPGPAGDPAPVPRPPDPAPASPPPPAAEKRSPWLTPGGISALAAVAAVLIGALGLWVQSRGPDPAPGPSATAAPTAAQASPSPLAERPALFAYGTSMPGMANYDAIARYVTGSARDSVTGQLYDSGLGYPLAKFGGDGEIPGFVLWLDPATADDALAEMTQVEAGMFHPVPVRTLSGVTADAYEWIDATDGYPRIDAWDGTTAHFGETVAWPDIVAGECFQTTTDEAVVLTIWCDAPHAYEAFHAGVVEPEDGRVPEAADAACAEAFATFVGRPPEASELIMRVTHGPAAVDGSAPVLCSVAVPGTLTVGTLAQSDR